MRRRRRRRRNGDEEGEGKEEVHEEEEGSIGFFLKQGLKNWHTLCPQPPRSRRRIAAMQCPTCGFLRSSSSWRPCQWRSNSAIAADYVQCKVCDRVMPEESSWSWAPTAPPRTMAPIGGGGGGGGEGGGGGGGEPTATVACAAGKRTRWHLQRSAKTSGDWLSRRHLRVLHISVPLDGIASACPQAVELQWRCGVETRRPSRLHVPF